MASFLYNKFKKHILSGSVSLMNSGIYVMLLSGTYVPSAISHTVTGDLGANEVVDPLGSYVKGGTELTSKVVGYGSPAGTNAGYFDAADLSWPTSTITAAGAAIYQSGVTTADAHLIAYLDFGSNQASSNGNFQILWNSQGIINFS